MSRRKIKAGSTSVTVPIFVQDTTSTTGGGLGSLVYNTASLAAKYRRQGDSSWTTITLATATLGTFTSGGFVSDGGPVTGGYEVGIPDAALATGAKWCEVVYYGAANMLPVLLEFELDAIDYQGAPDVNVTKVNSVSAASVTAVNANLGTTQPLNFTGTGGSALVKADTIDLAGTAQTAADVGSLAAAIKAKTDNLPADPADASDIAAAFTSLQSHGDLTWTTATGFSTLTAGDVWANATRTLSAATNITSDGLTISQTQLAHLDADVSSRLATASYTAAPTAADNATALLTDLLSGSDFATAGSFGKLVKDNLDAAISTRLATASYTAPLDAAGTRTAVGLASANLDAQLSTIAGYIDTEVAAIKTQTDKLTFTGGTLLQVDVQDWLGSAAPAMTGDAYAAITSAVPDSIPADGSLPSVQQAVYMILQSLIEGGISGTTWTIKKPDGSTTLFTVTLDSATTPASKTRAT